MYNPTIKADKRGASQCKGLNTAISVELQAAHTEPIITRAALTTYIIMSSNCS